MNTITYCCILANKVLIDVSLSSDNTVMGRESTALMNEKALKIATPLLIYQIYVHNKLEIKLRMQRK